MSRSFPLLDRLRRETAEAHQQLEDFLDIPSVIHSVESYTRLLAGFYGFHRGVEEALEEAGCWPVGDYDLAARLKSPWLAEDLLTLGWSRGQIERLPICLPETLPQLQTEAGGAEAALGCAYVMEGSTLGGRHISAMIAKGSAIPEGAFRFFQGYGADTGGKWTAFLNVLAAFDAAAGVEDSDRAVQAARRTFQSFSLWMQRDLPST